MALLPASCMSCQLLVDADHVVLLVGQLLNHLSSRTCAAQQLGELSARKQHTA